MSSEFYLDINSPLIYGPHCGNFIFCFKSPWEFRIAIQPEFASELNSNKAAIMYPVLVTDKAVGPNLPWNWWKTLI